MNIKRVALAGAALLMGILPFSTAHAAGSDFSVQAVVPATQIDKSNTSYFDLKLNPGQQEKLTFNLQNTSNKDITIDVTAGTAGTSNAGAVDYTANGPFDASLPDQLGKYMQAPEKVTIPAKQTQAVNVQLTMPNKAVTGVMAGGVHFLEEGQNAQKAGSGMNINSVLSYTVAVLARNTTDNNDVADTLNTGRVAPVSKNGHTTINAEVSNPKQALLNRLEITGKVRDAEGKVAYKGAQKMMQMAPNSKFDFTIDSNGQRLAAGKYTATYTAFWSENVNGKYADATGTRFDYRKDWTETCTVTADQAKKFNNNDAMIKAKGSLPVIMWVIIGVVVLLVLVIVGLIWFILAKRRKEEREENMDKLK